jgi:hypothetical protein
MPTDETTIHHLTYGGWISGADPHDRVESWRRTVKDGQRVTWKCEWVDLRKPIEERDALRKRYREFMV